MIKIAYGLMQTGYQRGFCASS